MTRPNSNVTSTIFTVSLNLSLSYSRIAFPEFFVVVISRKTFQPLIRLIVFPLTFWGFLLMHVFLGILEVLVDPLALDEVARTASHQVGRIFLPLASQRQGNLGQIATRLSTTLVE